MGCTNSHVVESSIIAFPFESIEKTVIPLTVEQKRIVRETWRIVEPNKKEIGVNVYVRFLSNNPSLKSRFTDFKDISVDEINKGNAHPRRLMAAIENSVNSLDDTETFSGYVLELGRRHAKHNFKPTRSQSQKTLYEHCSSTTGTTENANGLKLESAQFGDLRRAFVCSIKEFLPSHWNSEVEESWVLLFDFMSGIMLKGINSTS